MAEEKAKLIDNPSGASLAEASRNRAKFSGHGKAMGAAGYRNPADNNYEGSYSFLTQADQSISINPPEGGFDDFYIGVAWNNTHVEEGGLAKKIISKATRKGIDLDLGCLYELKDGTRGAIQAFGEKFGDYNKPPYIQHSGDELLGNKVEDDERLFINGKKWNEIKTILVYAYIYNGAARWADVEPQIHIDVPGENDLVVTLGSYDGALELCVIGELENVRGGIKLTNRSEYFPGHAEMDRAYGFGLEWSDGKKE